MLGKVTGEPAQTYSIGFDAAGYDEMAYARIAARHFGAEHHEYYVTPADLVSRIPKVATGYEQPFGNSSAVPALICAERARDDGVSKMLAGDGGDELFGGNSRYAKERIFEWYKSMPAALRRFAFEPLAAVPYIDRVPVARKAASYVRQACVPLPDRMQSYNMLLRIGAAEVFEPSFLDAVDQQHPFVLQRATWSGIDASSFIDRMLAFDWKYTLADNDLPKVVGTAQLAGITVGFPLLADELVELSAQLPPEWKLKGSELRWFFKHALRNFLPEEILRKQKHGFGLPFGLWASQDAALAGLARDTLSSLGTRGMVRPAFVDSLLRDRLPKHPGYYGEMVWILQVLELWIRHVAPAWRA
jgi:asparagine synthase (glutamine-hydrolysing)